MKWDELLGERARALEVRSLPAGTRRERAPSEVRLLVAVERLSAPDRACLEAADARIESRAGPGLALVAARLEALEALAPGSEAIRCLLAAERCASRPPGPPRLMGIVNATPNSFSDGGRFLAPDRAIEQGLKLIAAGADIIDVGGESTRPGAEPVSSAEELERVLPVVRALATDARAVVSIDTMKAEVAAAALEAGARIVNDVSAARQDARMLAVVAEHRAGLVLMHMQGSPRTMQQAPRYDDVVREVTAHLRERAAAAWSAGVDPAGLALDPGIGFGKRLEDNLALIGALGELRSLGFPLVLGVSRKSFLGQLSGTGAAGERSHETSAAVALGAYLGAEIHRVHDVASARAALSVAAALAGSGAPRPPEERR